MIAEEREIVAIAFVLGSPSFAGSLFVVAEHENDYVGFLRDFDGFRDALRVFDGIAEFDFVSVPVGEWFR